MQRGSEQHKMPYNYYNSSFQSDMSTLRSKSLRVCVRCHFLQPAVDYHHVGRSSTHLSTLRSKLLHVCMWRYFLQFGINHNYTQPPTYLSPLRSKLLHLYVRCYILQFAIDHNDNEHNNSRRCGLSITC